MSTSAAPSSRPDRAAASTWPSLAGIQAIAFDFDGVFTDNKVYVSQEGIELVRCDRGDGMGIGMLNAALKRGLLRADAFIVTRERNPVTEMRARKIGLACHSGCEDKLAFVETRLRGAGAEFSGLIYLGNDVNDLGVMMRAGFSVAPADAHERVRSIASVVMPQRGGEGFVRAFVERLLAVEFMTTEELNELVHHR